MSIHNKNFLYKLSSIRKTAFSYLESQMAKTGITDVPPSFGDVLYIIHTLKEGYVSDIVKNSYRDKSTVSNMIHQLEKKGYVKKMPDAEDGRRIKVRLTEKAQKYVDEMTDISNSLREKLFDNMSDEEQQILFLLLEKIETNLIK